MTWSLSVCIQLSQCMSPQSSVQLNCSRSSSTTLHFVSVVTFNSKTIHRFFSVSIVLHLDRDNRLTRLPRLLLCYILIQTNHAISPQPFRCQHCDDIEDNGGESLKFMLNLRFIEVV